MFIHIPTVSDYRAKHQKEQLKYELKLNLEKRDQFRNEIQTVFKTIIEEQNVFKY